MTPSLILLVDDAADVGLIVQRFARRAGHTVVVQPDAESAWEYLHRSPRPDLVLLDFNLPGANGADLCQCLRAVPTLADLRIALFSHWQRPQDVLHGLNAGANFVLSKDLLCQPEAWNARLGEILPPAPGRPEPLSLPWWKTDTPAAQELGRRVNVALRSAARDPLTPEIVRLLARRAATSADDALPVCFAADGLGLDSDRPSPSPESVHRFANACVEQMWSLLGTAGSAFFREALEAAAPLFPEFPPDS